MPYAQTPSSGFVYDMSKTCQIRTNPCLRLPPTNPFEKKAYVLHEKKFDICKIRTELVLYLCSLSSIHLTMLIEFEFGSVRSFHEL